MRAVFDHAAVGITITDRKENVVRCNPFLVQLLGMEQSDIVGKPVKNLYPAFEWHRIRTHHIRQLGLKHHFETKVINSHGRLIDVSVAASVLKDSKGRVVGSIGFIRDMSEQKKLERIRKEFVGVIAHELRTPLVPMREGISQVLEGLLGDINKRQREYLTIVFHEVDRLKRIIDDLLDIFKFEIDKTPMAKDLIDFNSLVKEAYATFAPRARAKGLRLRIKIPDQSIMLYADADRIRQVFANLIGNALKFTKKGTCAITVEVKKRTIDCAVTDTGEGIAKKDVALLFKKFQKFKQPATIEERGTGLGLALCKNIVELHQGTIGVKSAVGKGTTVSFTLPRSSPQALFQELIADNLKDAVQCDSSFSIVVFGLQHGAALLRTIGKDKTASALGTLELLVRNIVRRSKDAAIRYRQSILTILPDTSTEGARVVAERISTAFDEYRAPMELTAPVRLSWKIVNFPADADTVKTLFEKIER